MGNVCPKLLAVYGGGIRGLRANECGIYVLFHDSLLVGSQDEFLARTEHDYQVVVNLVGTSRFSNKVATRDVADSQLNAPGGIGEKRNVHGGGGDGIRRQDPGPGDLL